MAPAPHIGGDGLAGLVEPHGQAARDKLGGSRKADRAAANDGDRKSSTRSLMRSPLPCALSWQACSAVAAVRPRSSFR